MRINQLPGFFIDIEGLDGSGASTQVKLVARELRKEGIKPYLTKEPTNGPIGKLIRQILKEKIALSPGTLRLLFSADGSFHLDKVIIPRIKSGEMVITDRYAWSTVAFGSVYLPKEWLFALNRDFIFPDLTFFIEVSPKVCLERLKKEKVGVELYEKEEELAITWDTYHWLSQKYWWARITVIDGERRKEEITADILTQIKRHPKFKRI